MNGEPSNGLAVALTGGIGCGKSEAASVLRRMGVPVLDADDAARDVVRPGTEALSEIIRKFGADVLASDGALNRRKLACLVFSSTEARQNLNGIVHPRVRTVMRKWVGSQLAAGRSCVGVIPLLFEVDAAKEWNFVICVSSPDDVSRVRLRERGWSDDEIERRRAAQWKLDEKKKRADFVIENDGSLEQLEARVRAVWETILKQER